jgi:hypothetical protein
MFKFHKKFVELRKKLNKINTIPYNILEFGLKVVINSVNLMKLMVVFSFVIINESSSERPIYEIFVNKWIPKIYAVNDINYIHKWVICEVLTMNFCFRPKC